VVFGKDKLTQKIQTVFSDATEAKFIIRQHSFSILRDRSLFMAEDGNEEKRLLGKHFADLAIKKSKIFTQLQI
jgi:hypothetical protein